MTVMDEFRARLNAQVHDLPSAVATLQDRLSNDPTGALPPHLQKLHRSLWAAAFIDRVAAVATHAEPAAADVQQQTLRLARQHFWQGVLVRCVMLTLSAINGAVGYRALAAGHQVLPRLSVLVIGGLLAFDQHYLQPRLIASQATIRAAKAEIRASRKPR